MIHNLKLHPEFYKEVESGRKNFEVRLNDRGYQVGDFLNLQEFDPENMECTGRVLTRVVTYILDGGQFGIEKGFVVMGLRLLEVSDFKVGDSVIYENKEVQIIQVYYAPTDHPIKLESGARVRLEALTMPAESKQRREIIDAFRNILMDEDTDCGNEILCTLIAEKLADAVEQLNKTK